MPSTPSSNSITDVTVVVCCYTMARLDQISVCLESLRSQTAPPKAVIVVVDGNAELAAHLTASAIPEQIVSLERNVGVSEARNAGAGAASTTWVAFLDDDAFAAPDWLERLMEAAVATGAKGVSGWSQPLFDRAQPKWFPEQMLWTVGCSYAGMPKERTLVRNVFGGCALLDRHLLLALGGFSPELGRSAQGNDAGEEADFCLRAREADPETRFAHEPSAVIHHRVPTARMTMRHLLARCLAEGRAKARIEQRRGSGSLAPEAAFVGSVVPQALIHGVRRGRIDQAGSLLMGVGAAALGYLWIRMTGWTSSR
jgi:GT2 family glycosyltransferase